jgi:hypothetical protein
MTSLTVQSRQHAIDIDRMATHVQLVGQSSADRPKHAMVNVSALGIRNDRNPSENINVSKKMLMCEVGWVPHREFGVHDIQFTDFAAPQLHKYAQWIGEVHFMTQVAKSILKTRSNPSSEIRSMTTEQHGVHLKDEAKLCSYWTKNVAVKDSDITCACMHVDGKQPSECNKKRKNVTTGTEDKSIVTKSANPLSSKLQDLHHMNVKVNIKAAMILPISRLKRDVDNINVRIDNDWNLEINSVSYE